MIFDCAFREREKIKGLISKHNSAVAKEKDGYSFYFEDYIFLTLLIFDFHIHIFIYIYI